MVSKTDQILILSDGRRLGYAEYGDLKGKPVLVCHGWPGSRLGVNFMDHLANKLHVRLISLDRPGYGLSDPKRNRTILEWANDVEELIDQLKIKKIAILGISGGGPFAMACAYKIPEKITKIGIVSGMTPTNKETLVGMGKLWKVLIKQYAKTPFLANFVADLHYIESFYFPKFFTKLYRARYDANIITEEIMENIAISKREGFRSGIKGVASDLVLYSSSWNFSLSDIKKEIQLWYGEFDSVVPVAAGKYFSSKIPNAKLTIYPGEAHSVFLSHTEEILKSLL